MRAEVLDVSDQRADVLGLSVVAHHAADREVLVRVALGHGVGRREHGERLPPEVPVSFAPSIGSTIFRVCTAVRIVESPSAPARSNRPIPSMKNGRFSLITLRITEVFSTSWLDERSESEVYPGAVVRQVRRVRTSFARGTRPTGDCLEVGTWEFGSWELAVGSAWALEVGSRELKRSVQRGKRERRRSASTRARFSASSRAFSAARTALAASGEAASATAAGSTS